jgi:PRTRC genetic system protein B
VREHEHKAALIYSHLSQLGWVRSLPKENILSEAAQCLTRRVSCYQQRRLPLEFSLTTDLKLLPLGEHSDQCAIVVYASEVQCLELQQPILRLERKHPRVGRCVWQALHRGLGLLGDYCSPYTLLHLLAMYYWHGEDNEEYLIKELKDQGEDASQIEMIRRADVERQFPRWVLERERESGKLPAGLSRLPFCNAVRRLMAFQREQFPDNSLECQSIPIVYIPWEGSVMNQVADEHFNVLNQDYETVQCLFPFEPASVESFQQAWKQFQRYLDVVQAVEDVLDGLLGAAERRPVMIGTPKDAPSELAATHALLLYSGANAMGRAMVTVHTVARGPGRYVLLPGKPASAPALYQLLTRFNPAIAYQGLLPANLLRHSSGELLWHCPSRIEPIFFQTSHSELNAISGKRVRHPHLLFHVSRGNLHVAALADERRPTLQSNLLRAPYFNVSAEGQICQGSMNGPRENRPEALAEWERAFFHSAFTHAQGGAFQITSHPKGHSGLWLEQVEQPRAGFPVEHLVPMKMTLSGWLTEHSQPKW